MKNRSRHFASLILALSMLALSPPVSADHGCLTARLRQRIETQAIASETTSPALTALAARLKAQGLKPRFARNQDAPEILRFITESRRELGIDATAKGKFKKSLDGDLRDIQRLYANDHGEFLVIENAQGKIVGTGGLARIGPETAEIRKLYLASEVRGGGVGRTILDHLKESASSKGYSAVELETYKEMTTAKRLYESAGFTRFESEKLKHEPGVEAYRLELKAPQAAARLESAESKIAFFDEIADVIEARRDRIARILQRVNTPGGVDYEMRQALDTLRNVRTLELHNLQNTRRLHNVAVYGSTNIPLYTLVMHGFLPLSVSENVWFRTPAATRSTYKALFDEIALGLPPGRLKGLNVLTEAKDVQYDNFRKMHVLGLNRKGKRLERAPSEVVLFTGSPETGRQVLTENTRKLAEVADPHEAYKQVFVGFGAGMNPMVVTRDAAFNMPAAIDATMDAIRINCGQDCIAPNFYLVNEGVADQYVNGILSRVGPMKPGRIGEGSAGYSPLTLSDDVKKLQDYREKYEKYLVNPTATIDPKKRLVSPHVFVFPKSMFAEVGLQEHYGPFITIFKYDTPADLKEMARDPRVQKKAMYASVFGDTHATAEVTEAVSTLQQNRHGVSVNTSIYADESGNMPFGGAGSDASVVATLSKEPGRSPLVHRAHRPALFSEEARLGFGTLLSNPGASTAPRSYFEKAMRGVLHDANSPPEQAPPMLYGWNRLVKPLTANRTTGLKHIREVIAKEGLFKFIRGKRPKDPAALHELEEYYGTQLVFEGDLPKDAAGPVQGKGVVLHVTSPDEGPSAVNRYRGTVNPHLGRGNLQGLLDGRKLPEYQVAEAIEPGIMARTETLERLAETGVVRSDFEKARQDALHAIQSVISDRSSLTPAKRADLERKLTVLASSLFANVRTEFPSGAFFKNFDEFATADLGIQITSFGSNPERLASQFVRRFEAALSHEPAAHRLESNDFQRSMLSEDYETGTKFLNKLLTSPKDLLVQARVDIAKTEMGFNQEFRIDFMDGEPVYGKLRFSHEYMPEEVAQAKKVIQDFFAKAPPEFRHLSGGADVARLADGSFVIIEFNFGSSSGTMMPRIFPIDSNEYISALVGAPTRFIRRLEATYQGGAARQHEFLKSLKHEKELWFKESLKDLSIPEAAKWMRNRYLEDWSKSPTKEGGAETVHKLKQLFEGLVSPGNEDLENLIKGAEYYIERTLERKQAAHARKRRGASGALAYHVRLSMFVS